jgi:hypothetical protein
MPLICEFIASRRQEYRVAPICRAFCTFADLRVSPIPLPCRGRTAPVSRRNRGTTTGTRLATRRSMTVFPLVTV